MRKPEKKTAVPIHVGRPTLKSRGWTDGLINRFLLEPDETAVNPHYKSGPPRKLYLLKRVEKVERSKKFIAAKEEAAKRQASSAVGVETKRRKMEQYLETVVIEVPFIKRVELRRLALEHWNAIRDYDWEAGESPTWLDKITVNYLRHQLTRYEEELDAIAGKVALRDAYLTLSQKVFDAISDAYPDLEAERLSDYSLLL